MILTTFTLLGTLYRVKAVSSGYSFLSKVKRQTHLLRPRSYVILHLVKSTNISQTSQKSIGNQGNMETVFLRTDPVIRCIRRPLK